MILISNIIKYHEKLYKYKAFFVIQFSIFKIKEITTIFLMMYYIKAYHLSI